MSIEHLEYKLVDPINRAKPAAVLRKCKWMPELVVMALETIVSGSEALPDVNRCGDASRALDRRDTKLLRPSGPLSVGRVEGDCVRRRRKCVRPEREVRKPCEGIGATSAEAAARACEAVSWRGSECVALCTREDRVRSTHILRPLLRARPSDPHQPHATRATHQPSPPTWIPR